MNRSLFSQAEVQSERVVQLVHLLGGQGAAQPSDTFDGD